VTDLSIGPARRDEIPWILELLEEACLPPDGLAKRPALHQVHLGLCRDTARAMVLDLRAG
jgi:hypothetical protein